MVKRAGAPANDPGPRGCGSRPARFGPWETNAYLVWDGRSTDALVLDPGMGAAAALIERAAANGLRLHLIANSHGHIDHIFDNAPLMEASQAPLAIHPDDAYRLDGRNNYGFELRPVRTHATWSKERGPDRRPRIRRAAHARALGGIGLPVRGATPAPPRGRRPLRRNLWPDRSPRRQRRTDGGHRHPAPGARRFRRRCACSRGMARKRRSGRSCRGCDGSWSPDGSLPDRGCRCARL